MYLRSCHSIWTLVLRKIPLPNRNLLFGNPSFLIYHLNFVVIGNRCCFQVWPVCVCGTDFSAVQDFRPHQPNASVKTRSPVFPLCQKALLLTRLARLIRTKQKHLQARYIYNYHKIKLILQNLNRIHCGKVFHKVKNDSAACHYAAITYFSRTHLIGPLTRHSLV